MRLARFSLALGLLTIGNVVVDAIWAVAPRLGRRLNLDMIALVDAIVPELRGRT